MIGAIQPPLELSPTLFGGGTEAMFPSPTAVGYASPASAVENEKGSSKAALAGETALGELVVSGGGLMATRTNRGRPLTRAHRDLNAFVIGTEAGLLRNESRKTVTTI